MAYGSSRSAAGVYLHPGQQRAVTDQPDELQQAPARAITVVA